MGSLMIASTCTSAALSLSLFLAVPIAFALYKSEMSSVPPLCSTGILNNLLASMAKLRALLSLSLFTFHKPTDRTSRRRIDDGRVHVQYDNESES